MKPGKAFPPVKQDCESGSSERREEPRFPGVRVRLLYSATTGTAVENLGQSLYESTSVNMSISGVAFDIERPMEVGEELFVLLIGFDDKPVEQLVARVIWQTRIADDRYRIGTKIVSARVIVEPEREIAINDLRGDTDAPSGVDARCPSCGQDSRFVLIGVQVMVYNDDFRMPLYDCSHCGTTRTITGLLMSCRKRKAGER